MDGTCYSNPSECEKSNPRASWLFKYDQWMITPNSLAANETVYGVTVDGWVILTSATDIRTIHPTVYLKSDLIYQAGDGSASHPYEIE